MLRHVVIWLFLLGVTLMPGPAVGANATAPAAPAWQQILTARVTALRADPQQPIRLYAAGARGTTIGTTSLLVSADGGATWTPHDFPTAITPLNDIVVDPTHPQTLYVSAIGVFKSTDGGSTWIDATAGLPPPQAVLHGLAIDPSTPTTLYVTAGPARAFKTTNAAGSWQKLPVSGPGGFQAVAVAPSAPGTIYLGGSGVSKSTDAGATWQAVGPPLTSIVTLAVSPTDPNRVYAGSVSTGGTGGLWESTDGGASWQHRNAGDRVDAVLLDPRNPDTVYVAGAFTGVRESQDGGATWAMVGNPAPADQLDALLVANDTLFVGGISGVWQFPLPVPHDQRYFAQTGYRIDNDTIWDYFNRRGGVPSFGYPTSRTFTFQGFTVQFFQRRIVQLGSDGNARLLNLLDPGLLNYTSFNGSTFPGVDAALVSTAPDPTNQPAVLAWVQQHAPDTVGGNATNFFHTFSTTVSAQTAFPNGGDASLLPGIELELWGIPTSGAFTDPNNHNFISLRWQRGIMLYDGSTGLTQGVLLADYLKAILTGKNLPADLAQEAANSPFLNQCDPAAPNWVHNPSLLPNTDLTNAFTQE